jgi:carboxyl-terminal processing protease
LPSLNDEEGESDFPLGPQIPLQDHQNLVFESLWKNVEQNYVYYETSNIDWNALHQKYVNRINNGLTSEEFNSLLNELETDLPENEIIFQSRAEKIEFDLADTSSYGGIGAFVSFEEKDTPHVVILDVMPGSPAEDAGLKAHDSILAIDGQLILFEEGLSAADRILGLAGTTVTFMIQTPGEKNHEMKLTRAPLTGEGALKVEQLENTDLGYVLFPPSVNSNMTEELLKALSDFSSNKEFKGLILDLRISNAIADWPLENMLTLFQNGPIGEIFDRGNSQVLSLNGQDKAGSQNIPLVILVGENTKGLPEIFAASMQSNNRATLIGSNTSGNIETLTGYLLPDGSQVFIASASFRFSGGEDFGVNGIRPDVQIEARWDQIIPSEDPVIQAAVESFEVEQ